MKKLFLSIDIGGTNIKYGLLDRSGNLITHETQSTPQNIDEFMSVIKAIIVNSLAKIRGVAISIPGKVNTKTGVVSYGGSLPFLDQLNLTKELASFNIPIAVENDGKSAVLAEMWLGSLKNVTNGAVIVLGTGVGGGIVLNGQLIRGTNFQAGELSFMSLNPSTANIDSLVGYSGSAVKMIEQCANALKIADRHDGYAVFKAINNGDKRVVAIFNSYCRTIATLILNIQSVIDLQCFSISGGISAQPVVVEAICSAYQSIRRDIPLIRSQMEAPSIVPAHFRNNANLYGALYNLLLTVDEKQDSLAVKHAANG